MKNKELGYIIPKVLIENGATFEKVWFSPHLVYKINDIYVEVYPDQVRLYKDNITSRRIINYSKTKSLNYILYKLRLLKGFQFIARWGVLW